MAAQFLERSSTDSFWLLLALVALLAILFGVRTFVRQSGRLGLESRRRDPDPRG
jgi:hypothetical protein